MTGQTSTAADSTKVRGAPSARLALQPRHAPFRAQLALPLGQARGLLALLSATPMLLRRVCVRLITGMVPGSAGSGPHTG